MNGKLCKYDNARLAQIVAERGVVAAVEEITPTAIADPGLRDLWTKIHRSLDEIEAQLEA
jgi:hypothetical protein